MSDLRSYFFHTILKNIKAYKGFTEDELATQRQEKFVAMGQYKG